MERQVSQGKIGRYVVLGELGRGAMGVVLRAQDPAIGRTVAIKTIRMREMADEREIAQIRERMFREAQAAGILSHTNIVTIYDIQEDNGMAYIFMEFVDGETLEKILTQERAIEKLLVMHILRQAAEALDYAHARGIVHRDIKPANIMVRQDGTAKIADFGIARIQSQSMTQTGQIMGTPNYMSPEQIQGKGVTGRADQYALAVIAYEVLTGEKPFDADSLPTLLFKVVSSAPVPPPRLNPTLDPLVDGVMQRALAKDPEDRFSTCCEFVRALEEACNLNPFWTTLSRGAGLSQPTVAVSGTGSSGISAPKHVTFPPDDRPERGRSSDTERRRKVEPDDRRKRWIAAAGVVFLAAGMWTGMRFLQGRGGAQPTPESPKAQAPGSAARGAGAGTQRPSSFPGPETPTESKLAGGSEAGSAEQRENTVPLMVTVTTSPAGARVLVDDSASECTSPCEVELAKGRHTLTALLEGYRTEMRIFHVPEETSLNVPMERKKGTLEVHSNPPGASIAIDDVEQPARTPAIIPLVIGTHTITVSLPGKPVYKKTFEMRADSTVTLGPDWGN